MALVYRAYDTIDDRTVAIKILKDEFLGNEEFIRRFKNESKAIAVLSHPSIIKVYDVSFGDRIQYIVEEYIDGITLKDYLEQQKQIPWKEAIHFTVQILNALQHAHQKGLYIAISNRRTSCCFRTVPLKSLISALPVLRIARPEP